MTKASGLPAQGDHVLALTHSMRDLLKNDFHWEPPDPHAGTLNLNSAFAANMGVGDFGLVALRKLSNGTLEIRKVVIGPGPSTAPFTCPHCHKTIP